MNTSSEQSLLWIGLGSNIGDRAAAIKEAIVQLRALDALSVEAQSDVWETAPVGNVDQGPFLNAVVRVKSARAPWAILQDCLHIESGMGRIRTDDRRWGPREIDLDMLLHSLLVIDEPGLQLPHPRLSERAFVLAPFAQIDPAVVHPLLGRTIDTMLKQEIERHGSLEGRCVRVPC